MVLFTASYELHCVGKTAGGRGKEKEKEKHTVMVVKYVDSIHSQNALPAGGIYIAVRAVDDLAAASGEILTVSIDERSSWA